jgi:hypothetical protein
LRAGQSASKVTSNCGRFLKELKLQLANLEAELREAGNKSLITDAEYTRRQNQLSTLKGRSDDLNAKFGQRDSGGMAGHGNDRGQLFGDRESGQGRAPYRDEPDAWRGDDAAGIMQGQQTMMRDQDAGLDLIAKSIARQKEMAFKIGDEIEDQNEMLDDLNEGMDSTNKRLLRETDHVVKVTNSAKAGGYGARFARAMYTRGCRWFPHMLASSEHACEQCHFLSGVHSSCRLALKIAS